MKSEQQAFLPKKQIWLKELYPIIEETLEQGGSFRLTVTGTSMVPTIRGGRDSVTLVRKNGKPEKYDLPLYRRRDGSFVLHRIVGMDPDGSYVMCGDHQWVLEHGILPEQMIGVVTEIERKGRRFSVLDRRYLRWVRFWVWALPMRRSFFRLCALPGRLRRFITRKK